MDVAKMPVQEKIAELERRIEALEKKGRLTDASVVSRTVTTTTTRGTPPLSDEKSKVWSDESKVWKHFDDIFTKMGQLFRHDG